MVVSSASSKTAIAAAFLLAQREDIELVGLTSPGNVEFVEGLGIYDATVPTTRSTSPERGAAYVDISGDGDVRQAVHAHFGDDLVHSMAVGATHHERWPRAPANCRAGPAFFFAPDRVAKRRGLGRRRPRRAGRRCLAPLLEWSAAGWRRSTARASTR